jgi:hypothetical protein
MCAVGAILMCAVGALVRALMYSRVCQKRNNVHLGQDEVRFKYDLPVVPLVGFHAAILLPAVSTAPFCDADI